MLARAIGDQAERRAAWHLRWRGWRLVARNWIGGGGELDLIASRWTTLLVVEVRKRATTEAALRSVDRAKLDRTVSAANAYIQLHQLQRYRLRIDLIAFDDRDRLLRSCDVLNGLLPGR